MGVKKIPNKLLRAYGFNHAVGNPEYQRLVGWAADQTGMSRSQAFDFINNLITAYDASIEARKHTTGIEEPEFIHRAPKSIM